MRDATDEFLMSRVAGFGDERAPSELYDRYGGLIHGAGMRYLGDRTLAEDLVQDLFLSVWRNAASFDPSRASFATWVYRITRNRATDLARRQRARGRTMAPVAQEVSPEPGDSTESILRMFDVVGVLSALAPAHREILFLAYFGGPSQPEISQHTSVPLGTVKSRMTAGLCVPPANACSSRRRRAAPTRTTESTGGLRMSEHRGLTETRSRFTHVRVVEQHLARCATCRDEERGLREAHERLSPAPLSPLPQRHRTSKRVS